MIDTYHVVLIGLSKSPRISCVLTTDFCDPMVFQLYLYVHLGGMNDRMHLPNVATSN